MIAANIELCRKLHKLSGWETKEWYKVHELGGVQRIMILPKEVMTPSGPVVESVPAYDLGYLLRKLRENLYLGLGISARDDGFEFIFHRAEGDIFLEADTLENNACKLAIYLFENGLIKQ